MKLDRLELGSGLISSHGRGSAGAHRESWHPESFADGSSRILERLLHDIARNMNQNGGPS